MDAVIAGGNGQGTAVDDRNRIGMNRIIGRINGDIAAVNQQTCTCFQAFHAGHIFGGICCYSPGFWGTLTAGAHAATHKVAPAAGAVLLAVFITAAGKNVNGTAGQLHIKSRTEAVTLGFNFHRSAGNINKAHICFVSILNVNTVLAGINGNFATLDTDAVINIQAMGSGMNVDLTAGDGQIVLADDAVASRRSHIQASVAIDGQIGFAEQCTVHTGGIIRSKVAAIGQGILRSISQGQENLLSADNIQRSGISAGNTGPLQNQMNLSLFAGIDHDAAVSQLSPKDVVAFLRDGSGTSVNENGRCIGRHGCAT